MTVRDTDQTIPEAFVVQRGSGAALWRQIADYVSQQVRAGQYPSGSQMPTEQTMAEQFSVNRHTIRQAMSHLADQGLVRVEQGRGTFVQESVIDYPIGRRTRFSTNILAQQRDPGGRLLSIAELPAEQAVADALKIPLGTLVIRIERLNEADGRPLNVGSHYFPKNRFPAIGDAYRQTGSISKALALCGVSDYTRAVTRVTARTARNSDAALLQQSVKRPILLSEAINVDIAGQPIEYGVARWASDRTQLVFEPSE